MIAFSFISVGIIFKENSLLRFETYLPLHPKDGFKFYPDRSFYHHFLWCPVVPVTGEEATCLKIFRMYGKLREPDGLASALLTG